MAQTAEWSESAKCTQSELGWFSLWKQAQFCGKHDVACSIYQSSYHVCAVCSVLGFTYAYVRLQGWRTYNFKMAAEKYVEPKSGSALIVRAALSTLQFGN